MPSKNSSKSIYFPTDQRSAIMWKIVGFLLSKPRLCMADLSSLGSILPVASVSKRLKASLNYSISSSVSPGLSIFFLAGTFCPGFGLVAIYNKSQQNINQFDVIFLVYKITMYKWAYQLSENYRQQSRVAVRSHSRQPTNNKEQINHNYQKIKLLASAFNQKKEAERFNIENQFTHYDQRYQQSRNHDRSQSTKSSNKDKRNSNSQTNSYASYKKQIINNQYQNRQPLNDFNERMNMCLTEANHDVLFLQKQRQKIDQKLAEAKILTRQQILNSFSHQKNCQPLKNKEKEKYREIVHHSKNIQEYNRQISHNSKIKKVEAPQRDINSFVSHRTLQNKSNINQANMYFERNPNSTKNFGWDQKMSPVNISLNIDNQERVSVNKLSSLQERIRSSLQPYLNI